MTLRIARRAGLQRGLAAWAGALIALAIVAGASAQTSAPSVQLAGLEAEQWPEAQAVLTVLDESGRPIAELTEADFGVFLDEAAAPITGVEKAVDSSLPIAVVLALDVSGSMDGGALDQAKAASHSFLDGLGTDDTVAIVTFGTTVETVLPFTIDRAAAAAAIDGLAAKGTTALYQATSESIELAAAEEGGRRAVVLLSDGVDNGSAVAREEALLAAGSLGAPVFAIGLGEDIDRGYLQALADASGGRFAETPTPAGLAQLYAEAGELLRGQYVVSFDATALGLAASDAATLRVEATVAGAADSDERVVCPQQLCVALASIVAGERIEEARTIVADVVTDEPIQAVRFLVDGVVMLELTEAPYEFTLAPETLGNGEHAIAVEASTVSNTTTSGAVTVQVGSGEGLPISLTLIAIALVAGVAVLAIAFVLLRPRKRDDDAERAVERLQPKPPEGGGGRERVTQPLWEEREPLPIPALDNVLGKLRVTSGPLAGQEFEVGGSPSSIGCSDRCRIRLPDETAPDDQLVSEQARVWVRDGQLMVHEVKRLTERGATGGAWQILAPGDDFRVWAHTFQFVPAGEGSEPSIGASKDQPAFGSAQNGGAAEQPANVATTAEETPDIFRDKPVASDPAQDNGQSGNSSDEPTPPNPAT